MATPIIDDEKRKALGKKIYETEIRHLVEPQEKGKFLVLDVVTGDYAVGQDLGFVTDELLDRQPDAVLYTIRIGYPAVFRLPGMRMVREDRAKP